MVSRRVAPIVCSAAVEIEPVAGVKSGLAKQTFQRGSVHKVIQPAVGVGEHEDKTRITAQPQLLSLLYIIAQLYIAGSKDFGCDSWTIV